MSKYKNKIKVVVAFVIIVIVACSYFFIKNKSPLQSAMDIPYRKAIKIEKILNENQITYKNVKLTERKGLSDSLSAYDLTDKMNNVYLLLLDKESKTFLAILNSNDELVYGMVDSDMGFGDISQIKKYKPTQETQ